MDMSAVPHEPGFDNPAALLKEGHNYISHRCKRYGSDVFSTRLMLGTAYCVCGEDAAWPQVNSRHMA